ncbi:MAG: nucleotidyltransferase family protein [Caldilineaceae bacterium]|nr:nucleotidyltransferase family protein [Caldilineaceae bacterium]
MNLTQQCDNHECAGSRRKLTLSAAAIRWLLHALREPIEKEAAHLLSHCSDMDWEELIDYADKHGLTPLLYFQVHSNAGLWAAIPPAAQAQFEQRYLLNAQRNLQIFSQLVKLAKKLKQAGIPAIVLKGVYLAQVVYQDRALRPMVDIDILVERNEVAQVENILQGLGYRFSDWKHRDWCLKNHYHLPYTHAELDLNIELHWDIQRPQRPYPVDVGELWSQAQSFRMAGVEILCLSHEHLLLYHCLHIAKHGFGVGIRPFCDLAAILRCYHDQINWHKVQCIAERWRMTKTVGLSLYFTDEFFGCVAAPVMEALALSVIRSPVNATVNASVSTETFVNAEVNAEVLETARKQILTIGSTSERLSSEFMQLWEGGQESNKTSRLLRRVLLPPDLMASIYHLSPHSWRLYLYYPVRVFDLFIRYPRIIRQLMRHDVATQVWAQETNKVDALREWLVM